MPCAAHNGAFETETVTITKTSATQLSIRLELRTFATASCSGSPTKSEAFDGSVTIDGQTTLQYAGQPTVFDQVTATFPSEGSIKWTASILPNGQLVIDFDDNQQGSSPTVYPTRPDEGQTVYTRQ